jgi:hypothetical protein
MLIKNATITAIEFFDMSKNGNSRYIFSYDAGNDERGMCYTPIDSSYTNVVRNAYREGTQVNLEVKYKNGKFTATKIEVI